MDSKISVVINTLNEEKNIERAMKSVEGFAQEVVVCDMHSEDNTVKIAEKLGAKVVFHKRTGYVEPARNFALSQTKGDWILILDADEEIQSALATKLKEIVHQPIPENFVEIPRKNIIFGKWIRYSGWWPDYNIRFFKKGTVTWKDAIHSKPEVTGSGIKLPNEESYALVHYHYNNIDQFIKRMNQYSKIQTKELLESGYKFNKLDLINKPISEFLTRYFVHQGFKDGLHGLVLSLLQAISFFLVYLNAWEKSGFKEEEINLREIKDLENKSIHDFNHWLKLSMFSQNLFKRAVQRLLTKFKP